MPRNHETIGSLREKLSRSQLPDDTPILVPASDHSYRTCRVMLDAAVVHHPDQGYSQASGDRNYDTTGGNRLLMAVLVE